MCSFGTGIYNSEIAQQNIREIYNRYIFSKKRIRIGEKLIWGYMIECDPLWTIDDLENRPYRPWDE